MLTLIAIVSLAVLASFQGPPPAPPSDQEYYDGFMTTLGEISLRRETTMVALASLDRPVAAIVADQVFREYATAMETAKARAVAALFTEEAGQRRRAKLPTGELIRVANELERSVIDATTKGSTNSPRRAAGMRQASRRFGRTSFEDSIRYGRDTTFS